MAAQDPRPTARQDVVRAVVNCPEPSGAARRQATEEARDRVLDASVVYIRDLAGRPRGTGFAADHHGTVITSHEAVDGQARLVLHVPGPDRRSEDVEDPISGAGDVSGRPDDRTCVVTADAVTPLPELDLALVRTEGLGLEPLPVSGRGRVERGGYVRIAAGGWREARVLGAAPVTYTATDRGRLLDSALELAIGTAGRDALRPGGGAAGGPVLDAATGAVVAVLGTALRSGHRDAGFAVPLPPPVRGRARTPSTPLAGGPLVELLVRNAATVPAYGPDLNLAGVLQLTATSVAQDGPQGALPNHAQTSAAAHPHGTGSTVERAAVVTELEAFAEGRAAVLGLVGAPGSGRTTELAALAGRRARGDAPVPTLWLRGADLKGADASVADAVCRALDRAARIVSAARAPLPTGLTDLTPERVARLAHAHGRPLLLLLDGPEEMPSVLAHRLAEWTEGTARWLRRTGARLVVACREEYWESAAALFPPDLLHSPDAPNGTGAIGATDGTSGISGTGATSCATGIGGTVATGGATGVGGTVATGHATGIGGTMATGHATGVGRIGVGDRGHAPGAHHPPCLRLGDLTPGEARQARARYGIPDAALVGADARHPLTLRLLAEVRAALPDPPDHPPVDRADVLAAHLDLMCLRIAVRLAAENGLRGAAVRRLAARVSGQVHEAARRCLGTGQGELDRAAFEAVFPWGPASDRLGGGTGWASAVLTEGLLVPAGDGYHFAHEELADWIQGTHLDLDEALRVLVHRRHVPGEPEHPVSAPHHRIGPVVQALLLLARRHGPRRLAVRLEELVCALDTDPHSWWAARLLAGVLLRLPDATPYAGVLRLLSDRIVVWQQCGVPVPHGFEPGFWTALHLPAADRCDLLRHLILTEDAPHGTTTQHEHERRPEEHWPAGSGPEGHRPHGHCYRGPRYLDAVAQLLVADPAAVQPRLTRWFDDERPLPAAPHATVATAAQALLYAHRDRAPDDLTDTLVDCPHQRAGELLAALAEEEPATLCRAVDRWARDENPGRRAAAMGYGRRAAPHVRTGAGHELLRRAALAVLARPADAALHGGALTLLVADPHTRAGHLPEALRHFATGDAHLPPGALAPAVTTHPDAVLAAFGERLRRGPDAGEALRTLADLATPPLARRVAAVVREAVALRPDTAGDVAAYVDWRLRHGPAARPVLFPLVTGLLQGGPEELRAALGGVLAAPGPSAPRPRTGSPDTLGATDTCALRRELLDVLLAHETAPAVLDAVLHAVAPTAEEDLRDLVHRVGLLLVRTPEGAAVFDRGLVELGRHVPGFAARVSGWLTGAPQDWAAVVGPSAHRMIESLARTPVSA